MEIVYKKGINYPTKTISISEGKRLGLDNFPSFSKTGSIRGMKKLFYGKDALLIRCGNYIYNVTSKPSLYFYTNDIEYKFRAECKHDIELFYNENKDVIHNLKYVENENELPFSIDAIATFESSLDLKQIISLMKILPDTHVMWETVKIIKEYTGIRV